MYTIYLCYAYQQGRMVLTFEDKTDFQEAFALLSSTIGTDNTYFYSDGRCYSTINLKFFYSVEASADDLRRAEGDKYE